MSSNSAVDQGSDNFVLPAYLAALPESGVGVNPYFAKLTITSTFIDRLIGLQSLCTANNLLSVQLWGSPDSWGTDPKLFRIDMPTLIVHGNEFWFRDMPMDIFNAIQTHPFRIDHLSGLFRAKQVERDARPVFLASDPEKLFEIVRTLSSVDLSEPPLPNGPPPLGRELH